MICTQVDISQLKNKQSVLSDVQTMYQRDSNNSNISLAFLH